MHTNYQKWLAAYNACSTQRTESVIEYTDKEGNKVAKNYTTSENEIFVGGTCAKSTWRDGENGFVAQLQTRNFKFFDPRVDPWTTADASIEVAKKAASKIHVYGLSREQKGMLTPYEIGRAVDRVFKGELNLLVVVLYGTMDEWEMLGVKHNYKAFVGMMEDIRKSIDNYANTDGSEDIREKFILAYSTEEAFN